MYLYRINKQKTKTMKTIKEWKIKLLKHGKTITIRMRYENTKELATIIKELEDYTQLIPTNSWEARNKY